MVFFKASRGDDRTRLREFTVRKKVRVVWVVVFQLGGVENVEDLGVWHLQSIVRSDRMCVSDSIGAVKSRKELSDLFFAFVFVFLTTVEGREEDLITDVEYLLWSMVLVGEKGLDGLHTNEIVFCLFNVVVDASDDVCSGFKVCLCWVNVNRDQGRYNAWGAAHAQLKGGKTSGGIEGIHDLEVDFW
jgi:hypothetical protein